MHCVTFNKALHHSDPLVTHLKTKDNPCSQSHGSLVDHFLIFIQVVAKSNKIASSIWI